MKERASGGSRTKAAQRHGASKGHSYHAPTFAANPPDPCKEQQDNYHRSRCHVSEEDRCRRQESVAVSLRGGGKGGRGG